MQKVRAQNKNQGQKIILTTAAHLIAKAVGAIPKSVGVYKMLGARGEVLYVGKAKNLRARVGSYARLGVQNDRIVRMVSLVRKVSTIKTPTERDALLLEANLIKKHKPRFNVLMRDDKSFPYILLRQNHKLPQLLLHRGKQSIKGDYFGPFASVSAVRGCLASLQKAFLLRSCSDNVLNNRSRPCLLYQIKRCSAPCVDKISPADYGKLVWQARQFLSGKSTKLQKTYASQMQKASEAEDFEYAAHLRDRIYALTYIQGKQALHPDNLPMADVFAMCHRGGRTAIEVFFFRAGQNLGNVSYFPKYEEGFAEEEILDGFIAQFYETHKPPKKILVSHVLPNAKLLGEALSVKAGTKVSLTLPKRGKQLAFMNYALQEAKSTFANHMSRQTKQKHMLEELKMFLGLHTTPQRIDVFDNSHLQGTYAIGAMIVATKNGFDKTQYRKFNIQHTNKRDDVAMMREVFTRRYQRALKENSPLPQLILIDGGRGQLNAAQKIMEDLGLEYIPLLAIAKGNRKGQMRSRKSERDERDRRDRRNERDERDGRGERDKRQHQKQVWIQKQTNNKKQKRGDEKFFMKGDDEKSFAKRDDERFFAKGGDEKFFMKDGWQAKLPPSPLLYFLQNLRDEAHRFAIGGHFHARRKATRKNPLDDIAGIGAVRKRALLHHFGSAKAVGEAAKSDLEKVAGINDNIAQRIYDYFHP